jgi:PAS domain S-box-containing protein
MLKKISLLFLEDHPTDAELAIRELRQAQINFEAERVETEEAFLEAITRLTPDIIISDYGLPQFNGLEALRLLKKLDLDVPFILCTGTLTEEVAVECMKEGATDYILKTSLKRLPSAVLNALEKSEARKQREEAINALRESEYKLRTLLDNMSEGLVQVNNDEVIEFVNERFCEMTSYARDELLGRIVFDILFDEEDSKLIREANRQRLKGVSGHYELCLKKKSGERIWTIVGGAPIINAEGFITGTMGVFTDITERKLVEAEREKLLIQEQILRQQAEQANNLKDEFLALVSHELLTPLNAILGWANLVQQTGYELETMRRAFEVVERNANIQNQIISDILDVSRIITGKINLRREPLEITGIIQAAVDTLRPAITAKKLRLETNLESNSKIILGDADRLQQMCWNLLANAVKFTPSGGTIKITLQYGNEYAKIIISDTGKGIEPEFLPFIFERFRQADSSTTRQHGGLGLGLAIARHLTDLHGGSIFAESEGKDMGSTFTIWLPLANHRQPVRGGELAVDSTPVENVSGENDLPRRLFAGLKVLAVDDEADALELINILLTGRGAKVFTTDSVDEALKIFDKENPDVLISDIGMPLKDGYDLIRAVQERTKKQNRPFPAIALTAYARKEDRRRTLDAGFQAYLRKPVKLTELIEKIIEVKYQTGDKTLVH